MIIVVTMSLMGHRIIQISRGEAGVTETLRYMRRFARQGKRDPSIRALAIRLTNHLTDKDWRGEIAALHNFVRDRIRYVRDVNGIETICTPQKTLEYGAGDCDDKSILLAALLESIGHPARFRAVGLNGGPYSHVYVETRIGSGWMPLETTVAGADPGWRPPNETSWKMLQL